MRLVVHPFHAAELRKLGLWAPGQYVESTNATVIHPIVEQELRDTDAWHWLADYEKAMQPKGEEVKGPMKGPMKKGDMPMKGGGMPKGGMPMKERMAEMYGPKKGGKKGK